MENNFFIVPFHISAFSIQRERSGLNQHNTKKVKDQIDTIEKLETRLKYSVNDRD